MVSSGNPASDRSMTSRGLGDSDAGPGERLVACGKEAGGVREVSLEHEVVGEQVDHRAQ